MYYIKLVKEEESGEIQVVENFQLYTPVNLKMVLPFEETPGGLFRYQISDDNRLLGESVSLNDVNAILSIRLIMDLGSEPKGREIPLANGYWQSLLQNRVVKWFLLVVLVFTSINLLYQLVTIRDKKHLANHSVSALILIGCLVYAYIFYKKKRKSNDNASNN